MITVINYQFSSCTGSARQTDMRRVKREKENLTAVETFESNQARPLLLVLNFWYSLLEIWQLSNGQQLESTLVSSSSWPLHSSADDLRLSLIGSNFKLFTLPQSILSLSPTHSLPSLECANDGRTKENTTETEIETEPAIGRVSLIFWLSIGCLSFGPCACRDRFDQLWTWMF